MCLTTDEILEKYKSGQREFTEIDNLSGRLNDAELEGISFDNCFIDIDFSNSNLKSARFTNGNIKTCDFRNSNLTNAYFENVAVDGCSFSGAKIDGLIFKNNYAMGQTLQQEDLDWIVKS